MREDRAKLAARIGAGAAFPTVVLGIVMDALSIGDGVGGGIAGLAVFLMIYRVGGLDGVRVAMGALGVMVLRIAWMFSTDPMAYAIGAAGAIVMIGAVVDYVIDSQE